MLHRPTSVSRVLMVVVGLALASACSSKPPPAAAADPLPRNGQVAKLEAEKFLQYGVANSMDATPEEVWAILTNAEDYARWNSTIVGIEGAIAEGEEIALVAKIDPDRTFDLLVSDLSPGRRMVWEDGNNAFKGVRTFQLTEREDGGTDFEMKEALSGWMLPMIEKKLPDFGPSVEQFAADLKREAEANSRLFAKGAEIEAAARAALERERVEQAERDAERSTTAESEAK